eukprot:ctg_6034.g649
MLAYLLRLVPHQAAASEEAVALATLIRDAFERHGTALGDAASGRRGATGHGRWRRGRGGRGGASTPASASERCQRTAGGGRRRGHAATAVGPAGKRGTAAAIVLARCVTRRARYLTEAGVGRCALVRHCRRAGLPHPVCGRTVARDRAP